jgi:hypothetical protein
MGERGPTPTLGTPPDEGGRTPALGTPPDEGSPAQTPEASLGTSRRSVGQVWESRMEIVAITGQSGSNTDGWKLISEVLQLRTMPDDEMETRHMARRAKGYCHARKFQILECD